MNKLILLTVLIFISCGDFERPKQYRDGELDRQLAPIKYRCSTEQMSKVHTESEWCGKNTHYNGNFCYGTAIIRNCINIKELGGKE